jgi:hypothetical protein
MRAQKRLDPLRKAVWVVCPLKDHLFRVPSLRALIEYLAADDRCDCSVFCLLGETNRERSNSEFPGVRLVSLGDDAKAGVRRLAAAIGEWSVVLRNQAKHTLPHKVILVDKWGLLLLPFLRVANSDAIYFNFELRINSETRRISRVMVNKLEGALHRRVGATIIQDRWRWSALKKEHAVNNEHRLFFLPNSSLGRSRIAHCDRFRQRLKVPPNAALLVYIGSLAEQFMITELVCALAGKQNLFLILHSPGLGANDLEMRGWVQAMASRFGNLYLSEDMLHPSQLDELIIGSDIGVAMVKAVEGNVLNEELMGFSSGKMCAYLQNGLPVITSRLASLMWVEDSKAGVCVENDNLKSIEEYVRKIVGNRKEYSQSAAAYFDECLSLDNYLPLLKGYILD